MKCNMDDGREVRTVWTITSPEAVTAVVGLCAQHAAELSAFHTAGIDPPRVRRGETDSRKRFVLED